MPRYTGYIRSCAADAGPFFGRSGVARVLMPPKPTGVGVTQAEDSKTTENKTVLQSLLAVPLRGSKRKQYEGQGLSRGWRVACGTWSSKIPTNYDLLHSGQSPRCLSDIACLFTALSDLQQRGHDGRDLPLILLTGTWNHQLPCGNNQSGGWNGAFQRRDLMGVRKRTELPNQSFKIPKHSKVMISQTNLRQVRR